MIFYFQFFSFYLLVSVGLMVLLQDFICLHFVHKAFGFRMLSPLCQSLTGRDAHLQALGKILFPVLQGYVNKK